MKKLCVLLLAGMCLLLSSCSSSEHISIPTPETVYVTFYEAGTPHRWELSQDEINHWVDWLNNLTVSPINFEESKTLIDTFYYAGSLPQYSFYVGYVGSAGQFDVIAYFEFGTGVGYLRMDDAWYCIANPTEPFNRF